MVYLFTCIHVFFLNFITKPIENDTLIGDDTSYRNFVGKVNDRVIISLPSPKIPQWNSDEVKRNSSHRVDFDILGENFTQVSMPTVQPRPTTHPRLESEQDSKKTCSWYIHPLNSKSDGLTETYWFEYNSPTGIFRFCSTTWLIKIHSERILNEIFEHVITNTINDNQFLQWIGPLPNLITHFWSFVQRNPRLFCSNKVRFYVGDY